MSSSLMLMEKLSETNSKCYRKGLSTRYTLLTQIGRFVLSAGVQARMKNSELNVDLFMDLLSYKVMKHMSMSYAVFGLLKSFLMRKTNSAI